MRFKRLAGLNKKSAEKQANQGPYYLQREPFGSVSLLRLRFQITW
ncbi:hypothetical protein THOG05_60218 [Vibrio rotiferianus]|nr:hypothetical protein THOG05_60218 [Vibrio rotiferianus]